MVLVLATARLLRTALTRLLVIRRPWLCQLRKLQAEGAGWTLQVRRGSAECEALQVRLCCLLHAECAAGETPAINPGRLRAALHAGLKVHSQLHLTLCMVCPPGRLDQPLGACPARAP